MLRPPHHCATICAPPMMSAHQLLTIHALSAWCLSGSACHAHSLFTCTACPSLRRPPHCCLPLHAITPLCNCLFLSSLSLRLSRFPSRSPSAPSSLSSLPLLPHFLPRRPASGCLPPCPRPPPL